jgi:DNA-binding transcriptional LysR family regulator
MAYTSSNLAGIQAAVAAGMGLSILSEMAIQTEHRVLTAKEGLCADRPHGVALVAAPEASPRRCGWPGKLAEFCEAVQAKAA